MRSKGFLFSCSIFGNHPQGKRDCGDANRDVDEEYPVPGEIVCENTAEGGPRGESNRACH